MNKKHTGILVIMILLTFLIGVASAQVPLGQWTQINEGFAKCAQIGQSAGTATWDRDDFNVVDLKWKNGEMYAWITYPSGPSTIAGSTTTPTPTFNYQSCNGGIFRHDTIQMRWFKVAEVPPAGPYDGGKWVTNNQDIFYLAWGAVYKLTLDYANYPTGWQQISVFPQANLTVGMVWPTCPACYNGQASNAVIRFGDLSLDAIQDTIYVFTPAVEFSPLNTTQNVMAKFSISGQTWTMENTGPLPHQAYPIGTYNYGAVSQQWSMQFADRVGGKFKYFYTNTWWGQSNYVPAYFFVYDPVSKTWKNTSRGPNYGNFTGNSCASAPCATCASAPTYNVASCGPPDQGGPSGVANWGNAGSWIPSWDKKTVYINTQSGVFQWNGDSWLYMCDQSQGNIYLFTNNGGYGKGYFDMGPLTQTSFNGVYNQIGGYDVFPGGNNNCVFVGTGNISTPNDGKLIYVNFNGMKDNNQCSWENGYGADLGIYIIKQNPNLPSPVSNLHLQSATYAGGAGGNNTPVNLGIGGKHNIYLAGTFSSVQSQAGPGRIAGSITNTLLGAVSTQKGKIIVFNSLGDTIRSAVTLGDTIYDYEIMSKSPFWMVVSGNFGVAVLDSMAQNVIWSKSLATMYSDLSFNPGSSPYGGASYLSLYPIVDIDNNGHVVAAAGWSYNQRYIVYNTAGTALAPSQTCYGGPVSQQYLQDITIKNDTVYLMGINTDVLNQPAGTSCTGNYIGLPVTCAWVKAHSVKSGTGTWLFNTYAYRGQDCTLDQADTKFYRGNVGQDGNVYAMGNAAGGNSVFRWNGGPNSTIQLNGCADPTNNLVTFDLYNEPFQTAGAAIAYYCTINPVTQVADRGQYIIPRNSNGISNSFLNSDSYINADQLGYVYVGGTSAYEYASRPISTINGKLVGTYGGGDMSILIVSPDYMSRIFWGSFSDSLGVGQIKGIAIRDNIIAICGSVYGGRMWTGASRYLTTSRTNCSKTFSSAYAINSVPFNVPWTGGSINGKHDAYLAVWYQDVWNYATCDSIQRTVLKSDSIISPTALSYKTDFTANKTSVCVGNPVTFTNISVGDSIGWTWNFGPGASLLPGTTGRGPFTVTYSTPGYKNVLLSQILKGNIADNEYKLNYINVLPASLTLNGPILGPDSVCSGATIYYSIEQVPGVTYYNWTVPPGSIILNGQGSREIQVALGSASGNVSVTGTFDCGSTPSLNIYVKVNMPMPKSVLIVCGNHGVLNASETQMKNFLISRGYNVLTMWDSTAQRSNTECMGLVIISTTVDTSNLNFKLREISTPVIVMNPEMLGYMSMTNGNGGGVPVNGTVTSTQVNLINNTSEMGEVTGAAVPIALNVYTSANNAAWGKPNSATSINIATVVGDTSKKAIFGYEQGAIMMGYAAPDRRVGFYLDVSGFTIAGIPNYTDTLFARAVCWCFRNCPTNRVIRDSTDKTTYCAGDSITIKYHKWGQFNGFTPADFPSLVNQVTVDNSNSGLVNSDGSFRFVATGNWNLQAATAGTVGTNFLDNGAQNSSMSAFYRPQIPYTGIYAVIVNIPAAPASYGSYDSLTTAAVVNITTTTGVVTKYVNQRGGPKQVNLGNFEFAQGPSNLVEINTDFNTYGVHVIADAITFQPVNLYPVGNVFTAQLSNQYGNFNFSTVLAIKQDTASGVMKGVIPASLPSGTNYQVRVVSSSPTVVSVTTPVITITGPPQKPGPITGPTSECQGATNIQYCVTAVAGATSYLWTKSLGMDFTSSPGTATVSTVSPCVNMNFTTSTGGTLMVQSQNSCGTSDPVTGSSTINLAVSGFPPNAPASIGGPTTVCNAVGMTYIYTVTPVTGATSYIWTLPAGVTVASGPSNSNSITLTFSGTTNPSSPIIGVQAVGPCGASTTTNLTVNVNNAAAAPVVGPITVSNGTCSGDVLYTITPITGVTYNWTYPLVTTTLNGTATTNQLNITYGKPTVGTVKVVVTNACGSSNNSVAVNITGDTSTLKVDLGPNETICGPNILDAGAFSSYLWNTGATTRQITANSAGKYKVIVTDAYGCIASDSVTITTSNPTAPVINDTSVNAGTCGTASMYLYGHGSTGNYRWYNAATGGTLLATASSYLAANLIGDTAFYVSSYVFGNASKSTALTFNGTNGADVNIDACQNSLGTSFGTAATIEFWVQNNSANTGIILNNQFANGFSAYIGSASAGGTTSASDGYLYFVAYLYNGSGYTTVTLKSGTTINDGNWHHVAFVFNNGVSTLYIDGNPSATNTSTYTLYSINSSARWRIGGNGTNPASPLVGSVDEFRFWTVARTQAQIDSNMKKCLVGNESGLNIYLNFEHNVNNLASNPCIPSLDNSPTYTALGGPYLNCGYCESARDRLGVTLVQTNSTPYSGPYSSCSAGAFVPMTAYGGSGYYNWYTASSGGSTVDTFALYTVAPAATTTYYLTSKDFGGPAQSYVFNRDNGGGNAVLAFNSAPCEMFRAAQSTFELWVKTIAGDPRVIFEDRFNYSYEIYLNGYSGTNGQVGWQLKNVAGTAFQLHSNKSVNDGLWHHLAFVIKNDSAFIYVDGILDASRYVSTDPLGPDGGENDILGEGCCGTNAFVGQVDEMRFWKIARTAAQILAYKDRCLRGNETGLQAYYPFNQSYNDATGNCAPAGNTSATITQTGPILSCTSCESTPRIPVVVTVNANPLVTGSLAAGSYCPGDSVSVPFSICPAASQCTSGGPIADNFNSSTLSSKWTPLDLTGNGGAGYSLIGNQLTLTGGGSDIWSNNTNPYMIYRSDITGNFDVRVKVTSLFTGPSTNGWSKAGFIFANNFSSLGSGDGLGIAGVSRGNGYVFGYSTAGSNGFVNTNITGPAFSSANIWLELIKVGTAYTFKYSTDSVTWNTVANSVTVSGTPVNTQIGLFVMSHDNATVASISFDNFTALGTTGGPSASNYYYVAQLSDSTGAFGSNAVVLKDSLTISGTNICNLLTDQIKSVFPKTVSTTASYKIKVYQRSTTNAIVTGTTSVTNITFGTNIWEGTISRDWHTAGNWSCGIPDSNSVVLIPSGTSYKPLIYRGTAYAKHLTITGGSLTLSPGYTLKLWGNFTSVVGGFVDLGGGIVEMRGSIPQSITNMGSISNLTINNSTATGVSLGSSLVVNTGLALNKGNLSIGYYNLNMCGNAAITTYSSNSYIVTRNDSSSASGSLVRTLPNDSSAVVFPLGNASSYTPATIYNTGISVCMSVRVFSNVLTHGLQGSYITSKFVNKTWVITPQSAGAKVNVVMQWNTSDESLPTFNDANCFAVKNIGSSVSSWVQIGPQVNASSSPHWAYGSNVTTFSKFSVTSDLTLLPLDFVLLSGKNVNGNAALTWQSSSDVYCNKWYVERSYDGVDFDIVGTVGCKFGSSAVTYNFVDPELYRNKYYRVREVDSKGNSQVSNMILLLPEGSELEFQISPNPSVGATQLYSKSYLPADFVLGVNMKSVYGVQVASYNNNLTEINKWLQQQGSSLSAATYIIEVNATDKVYRFKWVLLK